MTYYFMTDVKAEVKEVWVKTPEGKRRRERRFFVVYGVLLVNPDKSPITHEDIEKAEELASRLALKIGKDVWIIDEKGFVVGRISYKELTSAPVYTIKMPIKFTEFPTMVVE